MDTQTDAMLAQVRERTRGRRILLVGGDPDREKQRALEAALGCEIIWNHCRKSGSYRDYGPDIRKTDIILLALRWMKHVYNEADQLARQQGKPYVRLTRGLGVNQVVHHIYEQLVACA
jgi:hypothetical protein